MRARARPLLIAEFRAADALGVAARSARAGGFEPIDTLTPFPLDGLDEALGLNPSPIRWPMLIAAIGVAALLYGVEVWSAVYAYPINSGARPLFSWQVFLLAPIEVGALGAGIAGFLALLWLCDLPRLNHPDFDWDPVERAAIDRYFLLIVVPAEPDESARLRVLLGDAGALSVDGRAP